MKYGNRRNVRLPWPWDKIKVGDCMILEAGSPLIVKRMRGSLYRYGKLMGFVFVVHLINNKLEVTRLE